MLQSSVLQSKYICKHEAIINTLYLNNKNKSTALVQQLFKKCNRCIYLLDVIIGVLSHKQYFISTCWCAANVSSFTCCCYIYYGASCSMYALQSNCSFHQSETQLQILVPIFSLHHHQIA